MCDNCMSPSFFASTQVCDGAYVQALGMCHDIKISMGKKKYTFIFIWISLIKIGLEQMKGEHLIHNPKRAAFQMLTKATQKLQNNNCRIHT